MSGGSKAAHRSSESRAAAMAHLKAVRDAQVCGDVYSDMATVTSSAGESRNQNHTNVFAVNHEVYSFATDEECAFTCCSWHMTFVSLPSVVCLMQLLIQLTLAE